MAGGRPRLLGVAWTVLVLQQLGVRFFGSFSFALALAALVAVPLDAYYAVRSPRVDDEAFTADRATRVLLAGGLLVLGVAVWQLPGAAVTAVALTVAGSEIGFNAHKSSAIRSGRPEVALRDNGIRLGLSLLATIALLGAGGRLHLHLRRARLPGGVPALPDTRPHHGTRCPPGAA